MLKPHHRGQYEYYCLFFDCKDSASSSHVRMNPSRCFLCKACKLFSLGGVVGMLYLCNDERWLLCCCCHDWCGLVEQEAMNLFATKGLELPESPRVFVSATWVYQDRCQTLLLDFHIVADYSQWGKDVLYCFCEVVMVSVGLLRITETILLEVESELRWPVSLGQFTKLCRNKVRQAVMVYS